MSPTTPTRIELTPQVREALGRVSAEAHSRLTQGARFLVALNAKAARTGSPLYAGISYAERARRRAAGRVARRSRQLNRAA